MIKTESFLVLFLVVYCPIAIVAAVLVYFFGGYEYFKAALWGNGLSIVLIWITVFSTNRLLESSVRAMLILVYGGLIFRFLAVIVAVIIVHFFTDLHLTGFFIGLLISYVLLQIIEIIYITKRFGKRKLTTNEHTE